MHDTEHTQKLVEAWFAKQRRMLFRQAYRKACQLFDYATPPPLRTRAMMQRWGSCTAAAIYLNPQLIHAPTEAIYYICVHELCHVTNPAHDAAFYQELTKRLPQWRRSKAALEQPFA